MCVLVCSKAAVLMCPLPSGHPGIRSQMVVAPPPPVCVCVCVCALTPDAGQMPSRPLSSALPRAHPSDVCCPGCQLCLAVCVCLPQLVSVSALYRAGVIRLEPDR